MHPYINTGIKAARQAGEFIVRSLSQMEKITIEEKSHSDFVTEVDRRAELMIIDVIQKAYPNHAIVGEELGLQKSNGEEEAEWIIDPLDGTTNFIHGLPHFAISMAVKQNNRIEHGLIYDPIRQEIFSATRGRGAQLNNSRIRVGNKPSLEGTLIGTGFPFKEKNKCAAYLDTFQEIFMKVSDIRRAGSAALDLAYVAAGRLDGFWESGLESWDIAAGSLLIKEAGGLVSDFAGGEEYLSSGNIVAGSPKVFKQLLQLVNKRSV